MMKRTVFAVLALFAMVGLYAQSTPDWTGTWATAPEWTGKGDMPQTTTLTDCSVRQIVHVSIGGSLLRMQLSNEFSAQPVEIKSVYVADARDSSDIDRRTVRCLSFGGKRSVTIEPGKAVFSDSFKYQLRPSQRLSITVCYGETPVNATSHRGSRTTSYIMKGEAKPKAPFKTFEKVDHWYSIAAIDVMGGGESIPVLGNSITDGRGSTTNAQNRWPDMANNVLAEQGIGLLNLGIGGNSVLEGGLSEPAVKRFDRDMMGQRGYKSMIIFEGINDIGGSTGRSESTAKRMIAAYEEFINKAHAKGVKVYGATIMPFGKCFYANESFFFKEAARQTVNEWIRTSGKFDGVIDFDQLMRDPNNPTILREALQEDWLHPNAEGYKVMGEFAAKEILRLKSNN